MSASVCVWERVSISGVLGRKLYGFKFECMQPHQCTVRCAAVITLTVLEQHADVHVKTAMLFNL